MHTLFTILLSLAGSVAEDQAILKDGTRCAGSVVAVRRQGFEMTYGTDARFIAWDELGAPGLSTAGFVVVRFENGDRVHARIRGVEDGHLLLSTEFFADARVPISALQTRKEEPAAPADSPEAEVAEEETPLKEKEWHGSVALSGALHSGNTDSALFRLNTSVGRQWTADRLDLHLRSAYGETEGNPTAKNVLARAKWDHFYRKNASSYVRVEAERDEIKNLDLRSLGGIGGGLNLWTGENDKKLEIEAGVDALHRSVSGADGKTDLAGRVAVVYQTQLFGDWVFVEDLEVFFPVPDVGEFVVRSKTMLTTALSESWFLQNGIELEWQGDAPTDTKALDLKLLVGLEYKF